MIDIQDVITIAKEAGKIIMKVYNDQSQFADNVEKKADNSPLTLADKLANKYICAELKKLTPNIPIISEEGEDVDYEIRKGWNSFWLVDPLDGTKEFIKKNGEFTVNIALIANLRPVLGVIQVPCTEVVYFADANGAFKTENSIQATPIVVNNKILDLIAVSSRSHSNIADDDLLANFDIQSTISVGSSLKFCYVAEGKADIYYREGHTMEWDTAAGQIIVEQAGGSVAPLYYNKKVLRNDSFCCYGFKI